MTFPLRGRNGGGAVGFSEPVRVGRSKALGALFVRRRLERAVLPWHVLSRRFAVLNRRSFSSRLQSLPKSLSSTRRPRRCDFSAGGNGGRSLRKDPPVGATLRRHRRRSGLAAEVNVHFRDAAPYHVLCPRYGNRPETSAAMELLAEKACGATGLNFYAN